MKLAGPCGYKFCSRPAHMTCSVASKNKKPRHCAGPVCPDHSGKVVRSREFTGVIHSEKCASCASQFDGEVRR